MIKIKMIILILILILDFDLYSQENVKEFFKLTDSIILNQNEINFDQINITNKNHNIENMFSQYWNLNVKNENINIKYYYIEDSIENSIKKDLLEINGVFFENKLLYNVMTINPKMYKMNLFNNNYLVLILRTINTQYDDLFIVKLDKLFKPYRIYEISLFKFDESFSNFYRDGTRLAIVIQKKSNLSSASNAYGQLILYKEENDELICDKKFKYIYMFDKSNNKQSYSLLSDTEIQRLELKEGASEIINNEDPITVGDFLVGNSNK